MEKIQTQIKNFWNDEEGMGTLEILLIIAVLIAIAVIFRGAIMGWINDLIDNIGGDIGDF